MNSIVDLKVGDRIVYNEHHIARESSRIRKRVAAMVGTVLEVNISGAPASFVIVQWDGESGPRGCRSNQLERAIV